MDITKFDKRIISRNLKNGTVSKKEHSSFLKNLGDVSGELETISIPLYPWDVEEAEAAEAEAEAEAEPKEDNPADVDGIAQEGLAEETS
jgi:hypothetical protein